MHPSRSVSGAPPRRALFANEIRGGPSEIYRGSSRDLFEDLLGQRPRDLAFENLLDVGGDGPAPLPGSPDQLAMQPIWNAPHLDHLGHARSMPHAWHMRKRPVLSPLAAPLVAEEVGGAAGRKHSISNARRIRSAHAQYRWSLVAVARVVRIRGGLRWLLLRAAVGYDSLPPSRVRRENAVVEGTPWKTRRSSTRRCTPRPAQARSPCASCWSISRSTAGACGC